MMLPVFKAHSKCTACKLCAAGAQHVGMRGRLFSRVGGRKDTAILIVGESPGPFEDIRGEPFIGPSGKKLDEFYVGGPGFDDIADTYVTNAVRCLSPDGQKPTQSHIKACRGYLLEDIAELRGCYKRLFILCAGAYAAQSVRGVGLKESFAFQGLGEPELGVHGSVPVFATYHPAYVLREQIYEDVVMGHLLQMRRFMVTGKLWDREPPVPMNLRDDGELTMPPPPPSNWRGLLTTDLETHAILIGSHATQFHPARMRAVDGLKRHEMIVSAGTYAVDEQGKEWAIAYRWSDPEHVHVYKMWLKAASRIRNQHLQFDLKLIRYVLGSDAVPAWTPLDETMVETFLDEDLSPERKLSSVAVKYGTGQYERALKHKHMVSSDRAPLLHTECVKDTWTAYDVTERARNSMKRFLRHPIARDKLSAFRINFSSDLVWSATLMEEHGLTLDASKLRAAHSQYAGEQARLRGELAERGVKASGTGKEASMLATLNAAAHLASAHGDDASRNAVADLGTTPTTHVLCCDATNRNALLGALPLTDSKCRAMSETLALINEYESVSKVVNSYTSPLLNGKRNTTPRKMRHITMTKSKTAKNLMRTTGNRGEWWDYDGRTRAVEWGLYRLRVWPQWFITPKEMEQGAGGGVRQPRWSAKGPAVQTWPETLKACVCSEHDGGSIVAWDLAQIEWRMAAYIANDRRMQQEIEEKVDAHSRSAAYLLGWPDLEVETVEAEIPKLRRILEGAPEGDMRMRARLHFAGKAQPPDANGKPVTFAGYVRKWLRQEMGKSQNFAWLYGGGVGIVVATCRVKAGIEVPESRARSWHEYLASLYPDLHRHRARSIERVVADGALHMPVLGDSRTYGGSPDEIAGKYRGEILDCPIQGICGRYLQSVIISTMKCLTGASTVDIEIGEQSRDGQKSALLHGTGTTRIYKSAIVMNEHDSMWADVCPGESDAVRHIARSIMTPRGTPYARKLSAYFDNRPLPIEYEEKVVGGSPT